MTGLLGELSALDYFIRQDFILLCWGLRTPNCQIDLVFLHPKLNQLIGVEVKASFNQQLLDERTADINLIKLFWRRQALVTLSHDLELSEFSISQSLIKVLFKTFSNYQIEYIDQILL